MELLRYRFKSIVKIKGLFIQCVLFPIVIATLCYTSFERTRSETGSDDGKISIGVVADSPFSKEIFNEDRFEVYNIPETMASRYLEDGVISSYIRMTEEEPELIAVRYDEEQKVTKAYLDAYLAGVSPAKLKYQHLIQTTEDQETSMPASRFAQLAVAVVCTSVAGLLLITLIQKNKRHLMFRIRMAAIPEAHIILQDVIVVVTLLIGIFIVLWGYIFFILQK
ncbi:MAG: hypothetical protein Q4G60_13985 [bacterium]|nr:hypothetical protein [bacterium]